MRPRRSVRLTNPIRCEWRRPSSLVQRGAQGKAPLLLDQLSIRGNTIRYFVLPENLNVDALLVVVSCSENQ